MEQQDTQQDEFFDVQSDRLDRLSRRSGNTATVNQGYSLFVRIMRLALPVVAVGIVAVLYIRTGDNDQVIVPEEEYREEIKEKNITRNELLNPKFESMDKKQQPYIITADRAIQGESNKDLIMLDRPVGSMTLSDGAKVTMTSNSGAYRQDTERFFLQGSVNLSHDEGYRLLSEEAHIDMKKNFAWSELKVRGEGPDITIDATGVHANGKTGEIVFTGPAKLVLTEGFEGFK